MATVDGTNPEQEEITSKTVQDLHAAYQIQTEAIELFDKDLLVTEEQFKVMLWWLMTVHHFCNRPGLILIFREKSLHTAG